MGAEAQASLKVGRKPPVEGKALLETNEIIFRGSERLTILFSDVTSVEAKDGRLKIVHTGGTAVFTIGAQAARWADRIKNPKSRIDKLGIKPNDHVAVFNVKDVAFIKELRARATFVSIAEPIKNADAIFLGATKMDGLQELPDLVPYIKRDGAIWTVTPKGKGGIKETDVMAVGRAAGLVDVKVVSFSNTHSANKFVIPKDQR